VTFASHRANRRMLNTIISGILDIFVALWNLLSIADRGFFQQYYLTVIARPIYIYYETVQRTDKKQLKR